MKFKLFSLPTLGILIVVIILFTTLDVLDWLAVIFCGIFVGIIIGLIKILAWFKSLFSSQSRNENSRRDANYGDHEALDDFDDDDDDIDDDDDDNDDAGFDDDGDDD